MLLFLLELLHQHGLLLLSELLLSEVLLGLPVLVLTSAHHVRLIRASKWTELRANDVVSRAHQLLLLGEDTSCTPCGLLDIKFAWWLSRVNLLLGEHDFGLLLYLRLEHLLVLLRGDAAFDQVVAGGHLLLSGVGRLRGVIVARLHL